MCDMSFSSACSLKIHLSCIFPVIYEKLKLLVSYVVFLLYLHELIQFTSLKVLYGHFSDDLLLTKKKGKC